MSGQSKEMYGHRQRHGIYRVYYIYIDTYIYTMSHIVIIYIIQLLYIYILYVYIDDLYVRRVITMYTKTYKTHVRT